MLILGIETSCDETAAAIVEAKRGRFISDVEREKQKVKNILFPSRGAKKGSKPFIIKSNIVSSQIKIHRPYGGVVPELAARNHIKNIIPVIKQAFTEARVAPKQIDRIAVTTGPGLITSLLVGAQTAKTLAYLWRKPIVNVNHLRAHLYAAWLNPTPVKFPALGLIVSGGHTELILMRSATSLKKIGQTIDDAAGEAFDKVAALLRLSYPGGPIIAKLAEKGNPSAFAFPRPMLKSADFNFSFSGLKTAVLYAAAKSKKLRAKNWRQLKVQSSKSKANLCASFQQAVVDVLVNKTMAAAQKHQVKTVILSGGVAANQLLRATLKKKVQAEKMLFIVPDIKHCTDNAAMIAAAGYFAQPTPWQKVDVDPNWEIG